MSRWDNLRSLDRVDEIDLDLVRAGLCGRRVVVDFDDEHVSLGVRRVHLGVMNPQLRKRSSTNFAPPDRAECCILSVRIGLGLAVQDPNGTSRRRDVGQVVEAPARALLLAHVVRRERRVSLP